MERFIIVLVLTIMFNFERVWASDLNPLSIKQIEKVQEREGWLTNLLVPEKYLQKATSGNPVKVPDPERKRVALWTRTILKPEWVPENIEALFVGLKDVEQIGIRFPNGSAGTADLLVAEYVSQGFRFHVIEDGLGVAVRMGLPNGIKITSQRESISSSILRFFNLEKNDLDGCSWEIRSRPYLLYGLISAKSPKRGKHGLSQSQWWERLSFGSDGTFLFVSASEIDENTYPRAQGCCPNRF